MQADVERARQELIAKKFPFVAEVNEEQYKRVDEKEWHPVLVVTLNQEITQSQRDSIGDSLYGVAIITETPEEVTDIDSLPPDIKAELMEEAEGEEEGEEEGKEQ